jgi:hypothetical protein
MKPLKASSTITVKHIIELCFADFILSFSFDDFCFGMFSDKKKLTNFGAGFWKITISPELQLILFICQKA